MEKKLYKAKETIADKLDLPRDIILDIPKITIIGDNEITIENHKGVMLFEQNEIRINSNVGLILLTGSRFEILFMGGDTLTISGEFKSIKYEKND